MRWRTEAATLIWLKTRHLENITTWNGLGLETEIVQKFRGQLPPLFWLIEASAPELFNASRRKFGEILLTCDRPVPAPLNASIMLAARLPGLIYLRPGEAQFEVMPTQLKSHNPLFAFAIPPCPAIEILLDACLENIHPKDE